MRFDSNGRRKWGVPRWTRCRLNRDQIGPLAVPMYLLAGNCDPPGFVVKPVPIERARVHQDLIERKGSLAAGRGIGLTSLAGPAARVKKSSV
jgi:hypothetical protein